MRVRLARFEGTFEGVSKVSKPHMPPDEKEPRAGGGSGAFVRRRFTLRDPVCRRGTSCRHLQTGKCIHSEILFHRYPI